MDATIATGGTNTTDAVAATTTTMTVTYTLGHEPALATGPNTFTPSFRTGFATVTFSKTSITLGGHRRHDDEDDDPTSW